MSTDELAQLQATNVVPSDLVIEVRIVIPPCYSFLTSGFAVSLIQALMARLKDAERERSPEEATASTEQNEQTNPKLCRYVLYRITRGKSMFAQATRISIKVAATTILWYPLRLYLQLRF